MQETPKSPKTGKYLLSIVLGNGIVYWLSPLWGRKLLQGQITTITALSGAWAGLNINAVLSSSILRILNEWAPVPPDLFGYCVGFAVYTSFASAVLGAVLGAVFAPRLRQ